MTRLQWLACWDRLREYLERKNSWGKNEILALMDIIEREETRKAEAE
jgi:hypothetical protein